jgi:hypothetical protein
MIVARRERGRELQQIRALAHLCSSPLRRLRKVDDSVRPVPAATLTQPEVGHEARLVAVVGVPNAAAEQDEATVTLAPARTTGQHAKEALPDRARRCRGCASCLRTLHRGRRHHRRLALPRIGSRRNSRSIRCQHEGRVQDTCPNDPAMHHAASRTGGGQGRQRVRWKSVGRRQRSTVVPWQSPP